MVEVKQDYSERMEALHDRYQERIVALLGRLKAVVLDGGYDSDEVTDVSADDYEWAFATKNYQGVIGEGSIDFTVTIEEQRQHEGDDSDAGLNFNLTIVGWGGLLIGGFSPFNYTEQVWVDIYDDAAVETRFAIFEAAEMDNVVDMLDAAVRN